MFHYAHFPDDNRDPFIPDRLRQAWLARRDGHSYRAIAKALGLSSVTSARNIVKTAELRMIAASKIYDSKVMDPICIGVWHTFTHDGRSGLDLDGRVTSEFR